MPRVKGPLLSIEAKGTLGGAITYQGGLSGSRVTKPPLHRDARSAKQIVQRVAYANARDEWSWLSDSEKATWNGKAYGRGMTGYNYFLQQWLAGEVKGETVLYLPMQEGSGGKVYDRSGYRNDGTISGASWTQLPNGLWVLSFDGVDDYVECPAVSIPDYTPWTVESILYVQNEWANFLGNYTVSGLNLILKAGEGRVGLYRPSTSLLIQPNIGASLNTWMCIVWSVDDLRNLSLSLNGELKATVAVGQSTALIAKYIAHRNTTLDYSWYKGLIGLVRFYKRGLTDKEIVSRYLLMKGLYS